MSKREVRYKEFVGVNVEAGTNERIKRAAENRGVVPAQWLRGALRRQLDADAEREAQP